MMFDIWSQTSFTSQFWKALGGFMGSKLNMLTAYHSQTDGQLNISIAVLRWCSAVSLLHIKVIGILHCHLQSLHSTQLKVLQQVSHLHLYCMVVNQCCPWNMQCAKWLIFLLLLCQTRWHACSNLSSLWNVRWTRLLQWCSSRPTSIKGMARWKKGGYLGLALIIWLSCQARARS